MELYSHAGSPEVWLQNYTVTVLEVHADQVVLKNIVVEHVLGSFTQVDDPLGNGRRLHAKSHILCVSGTSRVVIAANSANAAGNEVRVLRVLTS